MKMRRLGKFSVESKMQKSQTPVEPKAMSTLPALNANKDKHFGTQGTKFMMLPESLLPEKWEI